MSKGEYGILSRLLHYFALNSSKISEMFFSMDQILQKSDPSSIQDQRHVFVSGLARAGTTSLMRLFYETGEFCSLTYRDMPFPLAPLFWNKLMSFSAKQGDLKERAHGDGLKVDFDSPEAIDEVFWRIFCDNQYIFNDRLKPMQASKDTIEKFRNYIARILEAKRGTRYLSKNNNNLLRLSSILESFPNSVIIIPFRDPIQQSLSLYKQHCHFVKEHKHDKFTKKYMQWLVHHEFGGDHRFFDVNSIPFSHSPSEPKYWLEQWINAYRFLLAQKRKLNGNILFVEYESLCDNPSKIWQALAEYTSLPNQLPSGFALSRPPDRQGLHASNDSLNQSYDIYRELQSHFTHALNTV